jgi:hypothetical protein
MKKARQTFRIIWVVAGILFFIWMFYSSQSRGFPITVLQSDQKIVVAENNAYISFIPIENNRKTGLFFYPGALVDPKAYASMARHLAEDGFTTYIVKLPFRSAMLPRQEVIVLEHTRQIAAENQSIQRWAVSGHSRGGAIASRFVYAHKDLFSGLILIGTTHPKDGEFDLSARDLPVMKIYGTQDGLASVAEIVETSVLLPEDTIWVAIDGGNHAQFGYYGTQLGDNRATISRAEQQEITISAMLNFLKNIDE